MGGLMQEAGIVSLGWDHIPAVGFSTQTQPLWIRGSTLQPGKLEFSLHSFFLSFFLFFFFCFLALHLWHMEVPR